jgi:Flp pilus assembly protein TadD
MKNAWLKYFVCILTMAVLAGCRNAALTDEQQKKSQARRLITQGLKDLNAGRIKNAVVDLQEAAEDDPGEAEPFLLLGQICLRAGQPAQAAGILENAAHLFPDNGSLFYLLAMAENGVGRKTQAIAACQRSMELFAQYGKDEEVYRNATVTALIFLHSL